MWQRWNQSSHIFEKSTDNGGSWTPLGLNASIISEGSLTEARMPANVAYTDRPNTFVGQFLGDGTTIQGNNSVFYLYATGAPAGGKRLRFVNYSDNNLRLEWLNDGGTAITSTPLQLLTTGQVIIGGPLVAGGLLTGNAGGRINGDLTVTNNLGVSGAVYEAGRGTPMGYWIDQPFNAANYFGSSGSITSINQTIYSYVLIGKTMILCLYFSCIPSVATTWIYVSIPATISRTYNAPLSYYQPDTPGGCGVVSNAVGLTYIGLLRNIAGTQWNPTQTYISVNMAIPIQ